jgi:hypothetical protein
MRGWIPVIALLMGLAVAAETPKPEEKQPVTDNKQLPRNLVKPWIAEGFIEYAGVYTALKGEEPGSARLVLTPYVGLAGEEMLSVCRIATPDLMAEPVYTLLGSLACDPKTGAVRGFSVGSRWRMVTYHDPNTGAAVFGIDADGLIYADWSHPTGAAKPVSAPAGEGEPPPSATPIPPAAKGGAETPLAVEPAGTDTPEH